MISNDVRESWSSLLGEVDRSTAIGNRTCLIAKAGRGEFIAHVRAVDEETAEVLKRRPAGRDTQISLYALRPSDDVSILDSHVLAVGGSEPIDLTPLYGLPASVERLVIADAVISGRRRLRAIDLPYVRFLVADWAALDLSGGFGRSLRCLSIDNYGRDSMADLVVEGCERIELLSIIRSRKLQDLTDLEVFSRLSHLTFYGCQRLSDFSPLAKLSSLRHLFVEGCRRLHTVEGAIPLGLETLAVTDCGTIDSIRVVANHPTLQRVAFNGDTLIEDRDLTPLLRLPLLHSVLVASRRGYQPSVDELEERFDWQPVQDPC